MYHVPQDGAASALVDEGNRGVRKATGLRRPIIGVKRVRKGTCFANRVKGTREQDHTECGEKLEEFVDVGNSGSAATTPLCRHETIEARRLAASPQGLPWFLASTVTLIEVAATWALPQRGIGGRSIDTLNTVHLVPQCLHFACHLIGFVITRY